MRRPRGWTSFGTYEDIDESFAATSVMVEWDEQTRIYKYAGWLFVSQVSTIQWINQDGSFHCFTPDWDSAHIPCDRQLKDIHCGSQFVHKFFNRAHPNTSDETIDFVRLGRHQSSHKLNLAGDIGMKGCGE